MTRWNRWRRENMKIRPNLRGIDASGLNLAGANLEDTILTDAILCRTDLRKSNLSKANLTGANLSLACLTKSKCHDAILKRANLNHADLSWARFQNAEFRSADLSHADLSNGKFPDTSFMGEALLCCANLEHADFKRARLYGANLTGAYLLSTNLDGADLRRATLDLASLLGTSFRGAKLSQVSAMGVVARDIDTNTKTVQSHIRPGIIRFRHRTNPRESVVEEEIAFHSLGTASFESELYGPESIRHLIDAGSSSIVLILGRFEKRRRQALAELEDYLRWRLYKPRVFDFQPPPNKELIDIVRFIAAMSEFVIVDLTDPQSVPLEIQVIGPDTMIPIVPIVQSRVRVFTMFEDLLRRYFWILRPIRYTNMRELLQFPNFEDAVIERVACVKKEIQRRRSRATLETIPVSEAKRDLQSLRRDYMPAGTKRRKK